MADGWIKLWRKALKNPWLQDVVQRAVFFTLLLDAEHEPHERRHSKGVIKVGRGQAIISARALARDLKVGHQQIRRAIDQLTVGALINTQTNTAFTLVTICNFDRYQERGANGQHSIQHAPNTPTNTTLRRKEEGKGSKSSFNVVAYSPTPEPGMSIVASAKPKQPRRHTYPGEFDRFWSAYPRRPTDTKAGAFKAWDKTVTSGVDPPTLQAGADRYGDFCRRTGHESMLVQTWTNREGWTASYEGSNGNGKGVGIVERVARRLRAEGEDLFGPDGSVVEGRSQEWRGH